MNAIAQAQKSPLPGGVVEPFPLPPGTAPLGSPGAPSFEQQVVEIVNQERTAAGQPPLKKNDLLDTSSLFHSTNMADRDFFAHCDPDTGHSPGTRVTNSGYSWNSVGENIAAGYSTPASVMAAWMNSSGHRANILSSGFREIGIGYYLPSSDDPDVRRDHNRDCAPDGALEGPYYRYWTQNFGRRNSVYPVVIDAESFVTDSRDVDLYVYGSGFAQEMRFRNENGPWSAWEPYQQNKTWQLSHGNEEKTVTAEIRNSSNTVRSATDTIHLDLACTALDDTLDLTSYTITSTETFEACTMITAVDDVIVDESADVTMRSPDIHLGPGFVVREGGQFRAQNAVPGT